MIKIKIFIYDVGAGQYYGANTRSLVIQVSKF